MDASYIHRFGLWDSIAEILHLAKHPSAIRRLFDFGHNSKDWRANDTTFGTPLEVEENYTLADSGTHRWSVVQVLSNYQIADA